MCKRTSSLRSLTYPGLLLGFVCLSTWWGICPVVAGPPPVSTELARDKRPLLPVVIADQATAATKATAAELAQYLGRISGAEFRVETGDGSQGIVLGRPGRFRPAAVRRRVRQRSFPARRLRAPLARRKGLYLLGARTWPCRMPPGTCSTVWDTGSFSPGRRGKWSPALRTLKIAVDERQSPSFYARRIWYNWGLWGYNDEPYRQWCQRNRAVKGFDLNSGHSYEGIIAANQGEFDKHPEYFALVGGQRKSRGGDLKFCISNPGLRQAGRRSCGALLPEQSPGRQHLDGPQRRRRLVRVRRLRRMGSVSDRVVTLANEVAEAINGLGLGDKYVGMYAYNQHSAPPHIRVHPHVIPSATTAFIGGGYTFDQIVEGWQAQGATMGVYDYLSVVDWDWNLPRGGAASRPSYIGEVPPAHPPAGHPLLRCRVGRLLGAVRAGLLRRQPRSVGRREAQRARRAGRRFSGQGVRFGQGADAGVLPSDHRGYPATLAGGHGRPNVSTARRRPPSDRRSRGPASGSII